MKCSDACSLKFLEPSNGWNRCNRTTVITTVALSILLVGLGSTALLQGAGGSLAGMASGSYACIGLGTAGLLFSFAYTCLISFKKAHFISNRSEKKVTEKKALNTSTKGLEPHKEPLSLEDFRKKMNEFATSNKSVLSLATYKQNVAQIIEFIGSGQYWNVTDIQSGCSMLFIYEKDRVEEFCYRKENISEVQQLIEQTNLKDAHAIFSLSRFLLCEISGKNSYTEALELVKKLKNESFKVNDVYIHEFADFKVLYLCIKTPKGTLDFDKYYFNKTIDDAAMLLKPEWNKREIQLDKST